MKLTAYILAADPAWIEQSVRSYYDVVDEIIVSYDRNRLGWTGTPVPVDECLDRLQAIDSDKKLRLVPGDYTRSDGRPMDGETYQRQCALEEAGKAADWVLQLDTDEILPNPSRLIELLELAGRKNISAVEWPMRVFFQRLADGRFLEICRRDSACHYEYPAPVAVRPGVRFTSARHIEGKFLRAAVNGDRRSLQVARQLESNEERIDFCQDHEAILHFSWVRTPAEIRSKIASWGHNDGLRSLLFYHLRWRCAPYLWRWQRDFHPFAHGLWPALRPAAGLTAESYA